MAATQPNPAPPKEFGLPWPAPLLALLLVSVGGVFATGLQRSLTFDTFIRYQAWLQDLVAAHPLGMLGLFAAVYTAAATLSLPVSAVLITLGGYLFGWVLGGLVAAIAGTLGATNIFLIARTVIGQPLLRMAGPRIGKLAAGFQGEAFLYLLSLRLIPMMPFWLTNLAAAFFGMRLRPFLLATQIGMLPICLAFAFAGSGLDDVIAQHESLLGQCLAAGRTDCATEFDARSLLTPRLTAALSVLGLLALVPVVLRYWRRRKGEG